MAKLKDFNALGIYIKNSTTNLNSQEQQALKAVGGNIKSAIQRMHGVQQLGWPPIKSNPTPLRDTGAMAADVFYRVNKSSGIVTIGTINEYASIHEYGRTIKMTDKMRKFLFATVFADSDYKSEKKSKKKTGWVTIPARPIWRTVLQREEKSVKSILNGFLNKTFK